MGAGQSTLVARLAISANQADDPRYVCRHTAIEPFENRWLEKTGVQVIRCKVQEANSSLFEELDPDDILFIDTSHVIRPQGDVLFLFFDILGRLRPGVLIHLHDIFTPRDYPEEWVLREQRLWNEQYLLEGFLANNEKFEILGAVNYLWHNFPDQFLKACPMLPHLPRKDPGSFWIRRK